MENAWLMVGLGNPGREYARTRHNVGFMAVERLAAVHGAAWSDAARFHARLARFEREGRRLWLCQPRTFMNLSGETVGAVAAFYRLTPDRVLIVLDDADLPLGRVRLRPNGSSGGHHGLESIEAHLGTREYPRLRIGIGRAEPAARDLAGWVLSPFESGEQVLLEKVLDRVARQVECWWADGIGPAMNRFNGTVPPEPGS
jgi:PTH1 family peptidyl-tRNA hydrolase